MDDYITELDRADSKSRGDVLQRIGDALRRGTITADGSVPGMCKAVCEALKDNNVKVSTAACDVLCALTDVLTAPEVLGGHVDSMVDPLADLLGNAKPAVRERASEAAMALMSVTGPTALVAPLLARHSKHKNWRVREGVLSLYAAQVLAYGGSAYSNTTDVVSRGAEALGDAQPEVRKAAADALAALALQIGLASVLSKAADRGARPAQVAAVRERYAVLAEGAGAPPGMGDSASVGGGTSPVDAPPLAAAAAAAAAPAAVGGRLPSGGGAAAAAAAPPAALAAVPLGTAPRGSIAGGAGGAPRSLGDSAGSLGSSLRTVSSRASGVGESDATGSVYAVPFDVAAADAEVASLANMHSSEHWRPGIIGFDADAGKARPVVLDTPRDLVKAVDAICATCATTATDWNARAKALDRLRGLVAGGACTLDGFPAQVARLRDPLVVQVQELRSSLAKAACLAAAELSAAVANTPLMEYLAEPLVEVCLKLTAVAIAVISTSADGCIRSLLHNSRAGFHRVLPRLCAGCRSKSAVTRARAAQYLLLVLRGWGRACLERHADELTSTVGALIRDADKDARAAGRAAYWSLAAHFPSRAEALLSSLDARLQRGVNSSETLEEAQADAIAAFCEPITMMPAAAMPATWSPIPPATPLAAAATSVASADAFPPAAPAGIAGAPMPMAAARVGRGGVGDGGVPAGRAWGAGSAEADTVTPAPTVPRIPRAVERGGAPAGLPPALPPTGRSAGVVVPVGFAAVAAVPITTPQPARPLTAAPLSRPAVVPGAAAPPARAATAAAVPRGAPPTSGGWPAPPLDDGAGGAPPPLLEPHLSALVSNALTLSLHAASGHGGGVPPLAAAHPLRDALAALLEFLVSLGAVDPRSVARAYGERLPAALTTAAGGVIPPDIAHEFGVPNPGTQPLLSDAFLDVDAVIAAARHICGTSPTVPARLPAALFASGASSPGPLLPLSCALPELLRGCLRHPHENVQLDALALLFALLDACVDVGSVTADALSDVIAGGSGRAGGVSPDSPRVRVFTVKVADVGEALGDAGGVATVVPVYARLLLRAGMPPESADDSMCSPAFRDMLHVVIAASTSVSEPRRNFARRVIAAMRRAYAAPVLVAGTVASLVTPLGLSGVEDGGASGAGITHRTQQACLMLLLSLLGDAGAGDWLLTHPASLRALLGAAATLLSAQSGAGAGVGSAALAATRLGQYVDALVTHLWRSNAGAVLRALAELPPDDAALLCRTVDATTGLQVRFRELQTAGATASAAAVAAAAVAAAAAAAAPAGGPGYATYAAPMAPGVAAAAPPRPALPPTMSAAAPPPAVAPPAAPSFAAADLPPDALPLTRANLELIRDALASGERERVMRGLHFLGRAVDANPQGGGAAGGAPPSAGAMLLPTLAPIPLPHRDDAVYLSLLERVVAAVLARVSIAAAVAPPDGASAPPPEGAPAAGTGVPALDTLMLQTALSVLRKLYRNGASYVAQASGSVLQVLLAAARWAPRDVATVLDRTAEECLERMPADLVASHLVAALGEAPGDAPAVVIAALRCAARLIPRLPPTLLVLELNKGRLMEAVARHFLSTSTDVRRAVVQLLVVLHATLGAPFLRFSEAYLTVPQQKLLAIYIEKEGSSAPGVAR